MTVLRKKIQISFWVFIALAILLAIFSVQNSGPIQVKLFFWKPEISLSILLIGTFLTGIITGALYAYKRFLPGENEEIIKIDKSLDKKISDNDFEKDF